MESRNVQHTKLSGKMIALMAAASGIAVANIYYIQPLLNSAAEYFTISGVQASLLATLTQTGYAFGLLLILPIADLTERKKLILTMILLAVLSLLGMYFSPNFILACAACLAVGVTSVIPQLLLPLCAKLSDEQVRGKNIGHIMSGLLTGVVLSRVVSGALFAPVAGKISDRKSAKFMVGINIVIIFVSYLCFIAFGFNVCGVIAGVILLDTGVNSCNVANQTRIQSLSESERNRITSVYMVTMFAGGAVGSHLGSALYNHFGWYGFCSIGIITQLIAVIVHVISGKFHLYKSN